MDLLNVACFVQSICALMIVCKLKIRHILTNLVNLTLNERLKNSTAISKRSFKTVKNELHKAAARKKRAEEQ